jgi:uncharacterized protein (TIGR02246 family)
MKIRLLLALAWLAIGVDAPTFAQQTSASVSEQDRQQIDAFGNKIAEAFNKNDATAVAALWTEDAVWVTPEGVFSGRQAIEKRYADIFQRWHPTNWIAKRDQVNAIGNAAWRVKEWSCTVQTENGPVQVKGYFSTIFVRDGDAWKIRVSTSTNTTPPPAPPAETR